MYLESEGIPMHPDTCGRCAEAQETTEPEPFCIDSDQRAEWLLRKLANLEAERVRVTAQAQAIVKQLTADAEDLHFLYGAQLESYCRAKLAQSGNRRRSVHFLQGTCAFRTVPAGLRISDQAAALHFAQDCGLGVVRHVATLDAAGYRDLAAKHLVDTGETLPGVETTPARDAFAIKF